MAYAGSECSRSADNAAKKVLRLYHRRKLWLTVPVLGLFAGAVLVVIRLTGSIVMFYRELD